jgi:dephospho-CoA kinase
MLKIALTGGIGSGKTTVSKIFGYSFQIPVYYADERARMLMEQDVHIKKQLITLAGNEAYVNKHLNKSYLAHMLFNNPEIKAKIDGIVHKAVIEDYMLWQKKQTGSPYHLHEAALVFEAGMTSLFTQIIVVTAPLEIKVQRLLKKGMAMDDIQARIQAQLSDEEKIKKSDFVIQNDEKTSLIEQVNVIHKILINYELGIRN